MVGFCPIINKEKRGRFFGSISAHKYLFFIFYSMEYFVSIEIEYSERLSVQNLNDIVGIDLEEHNHPLFQGGGYIKCGRRTNLYFLEFEIC